MPKNYNLINDHQTTNISTRNQYPQASNEM